MPYSEMCNFVGKMPHSTPETLRAIRIEIGLSQSQIANLLGLSRFTISKMERGLYPISRRLDYSLAFLMDVRRKILIESVRREFGTEVLGVNNSHEQPKKSPPPSVRINHGKKKKKRR